jgi:hypothetical protein
MALQGGSVRVGGRERGSRLPVTGKPTWLIPTPSDQNPCAQSRSPMDMMVQGCSTSLFQAWQQ